MQANVTQHNKNISLTFAVKMNRSEIKANKLAIKL